jgi:hypothetical protein
VPGLVWRAIVLAKLIFGHIILGATLDEIVCIFSPPSFKKFSSFAESNPIVYSFRFSKFDFSADTLLK